MNFSDALNLIKQGFKVQRKGWNGKKMWITICNDYTPYNVDCNNYDILPFIIMKTADDKLVPWLASQTDILADDWTYYTNR